MRIQTDVSYTDTKGNDKSLSLLIQARFQRRNGAGLLPIRVLRLLEEKESEVSVLDVLFTYTKDQVPTFRKSVKPSFSILETKPASPPISSLSKRLFTSAIYT